MTYQEVVLDNAPVLYWALDEAASIVRDSGPNGYDADAIYAPHRPKIKYPAYLDATWQMTGVNVNAYSYNAITGQTNYTVVTGDVLEYDVKWVSGPVVNKQMAIDLYFTNGWVLRQWSGAGYNDQNNIPPHPASDLSAFATDTWYSRKIPLSPYNGAVLNQWWLVCESDTAGTYVGQFRNMRIVNGTTVKYVAFYNDDHTTTPTALTASPAGPGNNPASSALTTLATHKAEDTGGINDFNARSVGDSRSTMFSRIGENVPTLYKVERTIPPLLPVGGAARTIECWVFPIDGTGGILLSYGPPEGTAGQSFIFSSHRVGSNRYIFRDGVNTENAVTIPDGAEPPAGAWSHTAFTLDSQAWTYYINGEVIATGTFPVLIDTLSTGSIMRVGQRQDFATDDVVNQATWLGRIAHLAIYPTALTQSDIKKRYRLGLHGRVSY